MQKTYIAIFGIGRTGAPEGRTFGAFLFTHDRRSNWTKRWSHSIGGGNQLDQDGHKDEYNFREIYSSVAIEWDTYIEQRHANYC